MVTSASRLSTVGGHRHCEHHYQGHLPSQILSLQLFLQRGPTQGESAVAQRVIVSLNRERTKSIHGSNGRSAIVTDPSSGLQVTGVVEDREGAAYYILSGTWDDKMESAKIVDSSQGCGGSECKQKMVYQTLPPKLLWKKYPLPYVYLV